MVLVGAKVIIVSGAVVSDGGSSGGGGGDSTGGAIGLGVQLMAERTSKLRHITNFNSRGIFIGQISLFCDDSILA